ncbi:unnamed protein product, partial [Polarella glacialis]
MASNAMGHFRCHTNGKPLNLSEFSRYWWFSWMYSLSDCITAGLTHPALQTVLPANSFGTVPISVVNFWCPVSWDRIFILVKKTHRLLFQEQDWGHLHMCCYMCQAPFHVCAEFSDFEHHLLYQYSICELRQLYSFRAVRWLTAVINIQFYDFKQVARDQSGDKVANQCFLNRVEVLCLRALQLLEVLSESIFEHLCELLGFENKGFLQYAFAAAASSSEDMLGLGCQIADLDLVTVPSEQDTGTVITSLFVAEVCCAAFPSQQWADMAVVAIVPPQGGVGLRGTAVAGEETGGTAGWFIILQGMPAAQDIVDRLSRLGCLRNDLPQAFSLAGEGDCIIGEGAYATVYHMRARDGTVVAVKQMNQTADYESIEREVSTLIELQQSEFVIGYYGMFWRTEAEQSMFSLVFELAPCGDLLYKILKTGAMTETTIRPIFTGIIEGLNHVHAHNIVHRDI